MCNFNKCRNSNVPSLRKNKCSGATFVEFAIILPLMMTIIGLAIDAFSLSYSLATMQYTVNSTLANGTLYVENWGNNDYTNNVTNQTNILSKEFLLSITSVNSSVVSRGAMGNWLTLQVSKTVPLNPLSRLLLNLSNNEITLKVSSQARLEGS